MENKERLQLKKDESGKVLNNSFRLKPDIYISKHSEDIILDSKYKVIYTKEEASDTDRKKSGVSISDVYQMLAYTVKLNVNICHLLYFIFENPLFFISLTVFSSIN